MAAVLREILFALALVTAVHFINVVNAVITTSISNTAVVAGQSVILNCSSNTTNYAWYHRPGVDADSDYAYAISVLGCVVRDAALRLRYATLSTSPGQCDLVVLNATYNDSGTYACLDDTGYLTRGLLTVLDSEPQCSSNVSLNVDKDEINSMLSCTVGYTDLGGMTASMTWTQCSPTDSPADSANITYAISSVNVKTKLSTCRSCICTIRFSAPTILPYLGVTNAPVYTYQWASSCTVIQASNSCSNRATIAAIVLGSVLGIVLLANAIFIISWITQRRKDSSRSKQSISDQPAMNADETSREMTVRESAVLDDNYDKISALPYEAPDINKRDTYLVPVYDKLSVDEQQPATYLDLVA